MEKEQGSKSAVLISSQGDPGNAEPEMFAPLGPGGRSASKEKAASFVMRFTVVRAELRAERSIAAKMAIIAITTRSATNVEKNAFP